MIYVRLCVFVFVTIIAIFGMKFFKKQKRLEEVQQQIEQVRWAFSQAQHRIQLVQSLSDEFSHRAFMTDTIHKLYELMPPDISLRSLIIDEKKMLTIQGYAQSTSSVNNFQASLLKGSFLKEINLQWAVKRRMFNQEVCDFKLTAQLQWHG